MSSSSLLRLDEVAKTFTTPSTVLTILDGVSFEIAPGDTLAITGPSGSGKSTLLGLMAGLDRPTGGSILFEGKPLEILDEDGLAAWRRKEVGFIFQSFRLVPTLTALENVSLPLEVLGRGQTGAEEEARARLEALGLGDRVDHFPSALSGGEQQRVAIARAYVHEPRLIFADEPTGSLDRETASKVLDALLETNKLHKTALVVVTHDPVVAERMGRSLTLERGRIRS